MCRYIQNDQEDAKNKKYKFGRVIIYQISVFYGSNQILFINRSFIQHN